jgi:hypothetical protein
MNNIIVTQVKNNIKRLFPWILNHHEQGFDTFIIFDDFSDDDLKKEIDRIKNLLNIKIIYMQTDGYGDYLPTTDTNDSNSYRMDSSLVLRQCRSYNIGLQMVKQINPEAWIAFIDVDELFVTTGDKNIINILDEIYLMNGHGHFYVHSFDVDDRFDLNGFYIASEESKYRWQYDSRQKTVFHMRGKSIIKANYIDRINQHENVVHTLFDDGNNGTFIKPHNIVDMNLARIHHFRKPNNDPCIELEYDDTFYNFSNKLKEKYKIIIEDYYIKKQ